MTIQTASLADVPALCLLLNSAYRGEASRKGWTTEADLISGETRTDEASLTQLIQQPGSVMLTCKTADAVLIGCVNLQQHDSKLYLGMLSVLPLLQGAGTGKQLLLAAEAHARSLKLSAVYMTVITARTELIDWYRRHGYRDTEERSPFPAQGGFGKPVKPLEFMVLEKEV